MLLILLPCPELTVQLQDRTREFRRIFRQWNYLQISKRQGRYGSGFDDVSLAVVCPACPHPGKNIPERWFEIFPVEKQ
jgi:hypothetical protein